MYQRQLWDMARVSTSILCLLAIWQSLSLTFEVEVLVGATLYANVFEALTNVEALLQYAAGNHALEGRAHDGVALSGLYVEEVDAEVELAVHADANALLDVLRFNHGCMCLFI